MSASWHRRVAELAAEFGCRLTHTDGNHLRLRHASGWTVITSASPSDPRAGLNLRAQLRRAARQAQR